MNIKNLLVGLVLGFSSAVAFAGGGGDDSPCKEINLGVASSCRTTEAFKLEYDSNTSISEKLSRISLEIFSLHRVQNAGGNGRCQGAGSTVLRAALKMDAYPKWLEPTTSRDGQYFQAGSASWAEFPIPASGTLFISNKAFDTSYRSERMSIQDALVDLNSNTEYTLRGTYETFEGNERQYHTTYPFTVRMICKPLSSLPPPNEK